MGHVLINVTQPCMVVPYHDSPWAHRRECWGDPGRGWAGPLRPLGALRAETQELEKAAVTSPALEDLLLTMLQYVPLK